MVCSAAAYRCTDPVGDGRRRHGHDAITDLGVCGQRGVGRPGGPDHSRRPPRHHPSIHEWRSWPDSPAAHAYMVGAIDGVPYAIGGTRPNGLSEGVNPLYDW